MYYHCLAQSQSVTNVFVNERPPLLASNSESVPHSFSVSQSRPTEGAHFWAQREEAEKMLMNSSMFETRTVKLLFCGPQLSIQLGVTFDLPSASTIALLTSGCLSLLGGIQAEVQTGNHI